MSAIYIIILISGFLVFCYSMKVTPERVTIHYANEKYIDKVKASVRRLGRKSGYFLYLQGDLKYSWGNNVTFDVILYELLGTEYKRTFVEFHFERFCDFIKNDPYIGKAAALEFEKQNISCPLATGFYNLTNLYLPMEAFPYVWPFERAKAVGTFMTNNRQSVIVNCSLYLHFEQKARKQ